MISLAGGQRHKNDPKKVLEQEIERLLRLARAANNEDLEHHVICLEVCLLNMQAGK